MAYDLKEGPAEEASEGEPPKRKPKLTDTEFLEIARAEQLAAIGIEMGDGVVSDRIRAMEYFKGEMSDLPSMPNRSKSISTDVSDAVLTALPDLVEIFVGGEDIGAFRGVGEEDEQAAKQETEVVNHVIMEQNPGFELVHDGIHDALTNKVGVYNFWIEEEESNKAEAVEGQSAMAVEAAMQQHGENVLNVQQTGEDQMIGPLYSFTIQRSKTSKCVKIMAVDPNRFAVARDTKNLRDTTYCCMMTTPRAQELKAMGFDPDLVDALPAYNAAAAQEAEMARDTAGENLNPISNSATHDLRTVCVYVHVIRVDAMDEGKPQIWRIVSDEKGTVLLDKEMLTCVPFAAGSPYRIPHRLYGRSLADLLIEVQKIRTALTRLHLDSGFFSINQRHEVALSDANEHTLSDYLNNVPGFPVRSKTGNALKPLVNARSDYNTLESLEYFATVAEQRTGIVRNAQGLNPDTLHDTAKGAQMLMTAAQKRLRMIARTLAETLFKDLFVGVHTLLRTSGSQELTVRLTGGWQPVDPSSWGERSDMTIEIGMGAGGREMDLVAAGAIGNLLEKTLAGQASGAISAPVVTPDDVFRFGEWFVERAGVKKKFFTDPKPAMQQAAQQPPQEDPETQKAKAELQLKAQELQFSQQAQAAKLANDKAAAEDKARLDQWMAQQQADLAEKKAAFEAELAERNAQREADLAFYTANLQAETARHTAEVKSEADVHISKNRPGGSLSE